MHVATSAGSLSLAVVSRGKVGVDNGNGNCSNRTGGVAARPSKRKVVAPSAPSLSSSGQQRQRRWERGDGGVSAAEANAKATHVARRRSSRLAADRRKRSVLGSGGAPRAAPCATESDERATAGDAELATLALLHGQIQAPQSPILSPEASGDYDGPAGLVSEFIDSAGNEFNVVLSNEDAPEVRAAEAATSFERAPSA